MSPGGRRTRRPRAWVRQPAGGCLRESRACAAQGEQSFPLPLPLTPGVSLPRVRAAARTLNLRRSRALQGLLRFPLWAASFHRLPHSPERAARTPAEEAPRCTGREGAPKCGSGHARAPALAPDPPEQGRRASASCTAPGRIFPPPGVDQALSCGGGSARRPAGGDASDKLRFPYENVRTRDQPDVLRAFRRRPCSAVAWACLKTLPYGDSVAGSVVAAATGGVLGVRCTGSVGGGSDSLCGGLRRGELSRSALAHEPTLGLRQRATLQAQRPGAIHRPWCALYRYVAAGWR